MADVILNPSEFVRGITLEITVPPSWPMGVRFELFKWLLRLAVWVGGFGGVDFVVEQEKPSC